VYDAIPDEVWDLYEQHGGNLHLDGAWRRTGGHTVFGHVFEGMDVVDAIAAVETDSSNKPADDVTITTIEIVEYQG
jgi:cyclophilin family peptidyl-prolyl cis-trans isomerase